MEFELNLSGIYIKIKITFQCNCLKLNNTYIYTYKCLGAFLKKCALLKVKLSCKFHNFGMHFNMMM